jgi:hypothetical protein
MNAANNTLAIDLRSNLKEYWINSYKYFTHNLYENDGASGGVYTLFLENNIRSQRSQS